MSDVDGVRAPKPFFGSLIIFQAMPDGPDRVVRPCSAPHREYWLTGYIVASCARCMSTVELLDERS